MITASPKLFAAAAPVSGLWEGKVSNLVELPMWVFHGENDELVPQEKQKEAVEALLELGGDVEWTSYTDKDLAEFEVDNAHMANVPTYNNLDFFEWLFAQSK